VGLVDGVMDCASWIWLLILQEKNFLSMLFGYRIIVIVV